MSIVIPTLKKISKTTVFRHDQNPPVLNTLHEVFHVTGGCKLQCITVRQTNTPINAEEIDIVVTIDGTVYTYDASVVGNLANNVEYAIVLYAFGIGTITDLDIQDIAALGYQHKILHKFTGLDQGFDDEQFCGDDIKVEIRQTSAIAAGARVRTFVVYETEELV